MLSVTPGGDGLASSSPAALFLMGTKGSSVMWTPVYADEVPGLAGTTGVRVSAETGGGNVAWRHLVLIP